MSEHSNRRNREPQANNRQSPQSPPDMLPLKRPRTDSTPTEGMSALHQQYLRQQTLRPYPAQQFRAGSPSPPIDENTPISQQFSQAMAEFLETRKEMSLVTAQLGKHRINSQNFTLATENSQTQQLVSHLGLLRSREHSLQRIMETMARLMTQQGLSASPIPQRAPTPMASRPLFHSSPVPESGDIPPEASVISKKHLLELVAEVDPNMRLDTDVQEMLFEIADSFVDSVTVAGCNFAKHRGSKVLQVGDLRYQLEKVFGIRLPGFYRDSSAAPDASTVDTPQRVWRTPSHLHLQRTAIVKKAVFNDAGKRREPNGYSVVQKPENK